LKLTLSREIKTAILVIAAILLFIWGYSFLKGKDLFNSYHTYFILYDNVEGLSASAPVTLNGLVIGKVNNISFVSEERQNLVEIQVVGKYQFSNKSIAKIYEPGFIGGKQIMILPDYNHQEMLKSGDYIQGIIKPGITSELADKLLPLQQSIEKVMVNADALLINLNDILDQKTKENVRGSFAELHEALESINTMTAKMNGILEFNDKKIHKTIANFEQTSQNFAQISDSLAASNLGKTIRDLENTLANVDAIMNDVQSGKGSLGKLIKEEGLYNNLEGATKELEQLLGDMKQNPKRYVHFSLFGKKALPYENPSNTNSDK
jgi:phospholipid/cholesterol/gamma-HCH transport system substrate-binding protein